MRADSEVLKRCFERLAETGIDITGAVYRQFEATAPDVGMYIGAMDERMRGRMLEQVFKLLLGETEEGYLAFEARMHRGYGANAYFYRSLLEAVAHSVREEMGEEWSAADDAAWNRTIGRIVDEIGSVPVP